MKTSQEQLTDQIYQLLENRKVTIAQALQILNRVKSRMLTRQMQKETAVISEYEKRRG